MDVSVTVTAGPVTVAVAGQVPEGEKASDIPPLTDAPALPPPPERLLDEERQRTLNGQNPTAEITQDETAQKVKDLEAAWNNLLSGSDHASLDKMIKQCGGQGPESWGLLVGKPVRCKGSVGLGDFGATILEVDLEKAWIRVRWDDGSGDAWKTCKLCWMNE